MLPDRADRDALYAEYARLGHALSSPTRLHLISLLAQGEKSVEVLAERCQQSIVNVSAHLKVLRQAHLVIARRDGRFIRYSLPGEGVAQLWQSLRVVAESEVPEVRDIVRRFDEDESSIARIEGRELLARVRAGEVLLVDLRPADEYDAGHIPGARSVPFQELSRRIGQLPKGRDIIAYCRGAYCVMGVEGVAAMRKRGLPATRLRAGVVEWRSAGFPLATTSRPAEGPP